MKNNSTRIILGQSNQPITQLRLPASIDPFSTFHLTVAIRDTFDRITEFSLPPVNILPDYLTVSKFIDGDFENDTIGQLLNNSDKNIVGQLIISISELLNEMNEENIALAIQSMNELLKGISLM